MATNPKKPKSTSQRGSRSTAAGDAPRSATRSVAKSPPAAKSHPALEHPALDQPDKHSLQWTFLTNHSHVLVLLARNPYLVLREVAKQVGITERAVQRIIADLEKGGFVGREKIGRQNHYLIQDGRPLRHPIESHRTIGELLNLLNNSKR